MQGELLLPQELQDAWKVIADRDSAKRNAAWTARRQRESTVTDAGTDTARFTQRMHIMQWAVRRVVDAMVTSLLKWLDNELYSLIGFLACMTSIKTVKARNRVDGTVGMVDIACDEAVADAVIARRMLDELVATYGINLAQSHLPPLIADLISDPKAMDEFGQFCQGKEITGWALVDECDNCIVDKLQRHVPAGPRPYSSFTALAPWVLKARTIQRSNNDIERGFSQPSIKTRASAKNVGPQLLSAYVRRKDWFSGGFWGLEKDDVFLHTFDQARRLLRENDKWFRGVFRADLVTSETRKQQAQLLELPLSHRNGEAFPESNIRANPGPKGRTQGPAKKAKTGRYEVNENDMEVDPNPLAPPGDTSEEEEEEEKEGEEEAEEEEEEGAEEEDCDRHGAEDNGAADYDGEGDHDDDGAAADNDRAGCDSDDNGGGDHYAEGGDDSAALAAQAAPNIRAAEPELVLSGHGPVSAAALFPVTSAAAQLPVPVSAPPSGAYPSDSLNRYVESLQAMPDPSAWNPGKVTRLGGKQCRLSVVHADGATVYVSAMHGFLAHLVFNPREGVVKLVHIKKLTRRGDDYFMTYNRVYRTEDAIGVCDAREQVITNISVEAPGLTGGIRGMKLSRTSIRLGSKELNAILTRDQDREAQQLRHWGDVEYTSQSYKETVGNIVGAVACGQADSSGGRAIDPAAVNVLKRLGYAAQQAEQLVRRCIYLGTPFQELAPAAVECTEDEADSEPGEPAPADDTGITWNCPLTMAAREPEMKEMREQMMRSAEAEDSDDLPLNRRKSGTVTFDLLRCMRVYILRNKH